ncbi:MAG: PmoA family protein [Cyclobacteriaceae bacterium]
MLKELFTLLMGHYSKDTFLVTKLRKKIENAFGIYYSRPYFSLVTLISCFLFIVLFAGCISSDKQKGQAVSLFTVDHNKTEGTISVLRANGKTLVLTQNARAGIRPYIHPVVAPDGKGQLTEYSPAHHKHQTGLYWGLKQVNGRDFFMNWREEHWRRISADVLDANGPRVKWRTVYQLLDENGGAILDETQTWTFEEREGKYLLNLEWTGKAKIDLTMGKFYVGGLFVRMPWRQGMVGEVVNAAGQRNGMAEGQRAIWNDIGLQVNGRNDLAHIAILDHPDNEVFPTPWRVDNELGVGPSRQILGDWSLAQGKAEIFRFRVIVYTGDHNPAEVNRIWKEFVCE